jgi:putative addiction module CopG family antidote
MLGTVEEKHRMTRIQLSPELTDTVERLMISGAYTSVDDVLERALRLLQEQERWERLQASLIEAEQQTGRGELIEWTPELRKRLRAEAEERARQGASPDPDVYP